MNPPELPPENVYSPPQSWGEPPPWQMPALPPAWPKVIGITAIVIASYGLLTNFGGIFTSRVMTESLSGGALGKVGFTPEVLAGMQRFTLTNAIGGLVLAVLLLVAGIMLVRRRAWSRRLMLAWAVGRIAWAAVVAPLMFDYMSSMMSSMSASLTPPAASSSVPAPLGSAPGPVPAPPPASPISPATLSMFSGGMAIVSVVFGTLVACVLPGFVLIWFHLRKVKAYMATWPILQPPLPPGSWPA